MGGYSAWAGLNFFGSWHGRKKSCYDMTVIIRSRQNTCLLPHADLASSWAERS